MPIQIEVIRKSRNLKDFLKLPWHIYRNEPNWVPPLLYDQRKLLHPKNNPFFIHAQITRLLARRDGKPVGRICAIDNRAHTEYWKEPVGFFGFFECENNPDSAIALVDAAAEWLKLRGLKTIRGPMNLSTNDTCGLLVDGFDSPPVLMMPYNPPYYLTLFEACGLAKVMDLYAYRIDKENISERAVRIGEKIRERVKIRIRPINVKNIHQDIERVRFIYNQAWSKNWGFVPMTKSEFDYTAADFKKIMDPELALIAEDGDQPVGFSIALPDLNVAFKRMNGRLLPFGIFKLLYYSKRIKNARVLTLGIIESHRNRGIDTLLYLETFQRGIANGYEWGEMSWILENNISMNQALKAVGAEIYKTYRIYEKAL